MKTLELACLGFSYVYLKNFKFTLFIVKSYFNYTILSTVCCVAILFLGISPEIKTIYGYTYYTTWWLGFSENSNPDESPAVLDIYYTYPDRVFAGQKFNVGVTLKYIQDNRALLDWIVFSGVSVGIKNYSDLSTYFLNVNDSKDYPRDLDRDFDNTSRLITPGEQYSYSLNINAPNTAGKYVIFPQWAAFYGPGTTVTNNFDWNLEYYYNQTDREFGGQDPDDIPPIEVTKRNEQNAPLNGSLDVFINSPYSDIKPIEIKVSSNSENESAYSKLTQSNGYALFEIPTNNTYTVTVPKNITIIPKKIQAVFVNWTDGHYFTSNAKTSNDIARTVDLQHDVELVPLYKTQYYLDVKTVGGINSHSNNGTGWYDSGDEAQFTANTFKSFVSLHSFDHWNGTISKGDNTERLKCYYNEWAKRDYRYLEIGLWYYRGIFGNNYWIGDSWRKDIFKTGFLSKIF